MVLTYHSLEDRLVKNLMKTGNVEGKVEQEVNLSVSVEDDGHNDECDGRDEHEYPALFAEDSPCRTVIGNVGE